MTIFMILVAVYLVLNMQFAGKSTIHKDYIGKEQCDVIKGIFLLMVFFRHAVNGK